MNFHSIYSHGFARVAACTIASNVADPGANATLADPGGRTAENHGLKSRHYHPSDLIFDRHRGPCDWDPALIQSNTFEIEWPRRSGRQAA
jgi:hypothetical protein